MDISNISQGVDQLTNILLLSVEQSTDLNQKLIKINVQQKLQSVKDENIGKAIDTFA